MSAARRIRTLLNLAGTLGPTVSIKLHVGRFFSICGLGLCVLALAASAAEGRIENFSGDIHVEILSKGPVDLQSSSDDRAVREDDVEVQQDASTLTIVCRPTDNAKIDLHLRIPMRIQVNARTTDGKISMSGFPSLFTAQTVSGEMDFEAPWKATRFLMFASDQPKKLNLPGGVPADAERTHRTDLQTLPASNAAQFAIRRHSVQPLS